jgi:hypothetical protein
MLLEDLKKNIIEPHQPKEITKRRTAEQDKKLRESIKKESPPVDPKPEDQLTDEAVHNKLKEAIKSNFTSFNVPGEFTEFVKRYTGRNNTS